jgi:hypothetical protein
MQGKNQNTISLMLCAIKSRSLMIMLDDNMKNPLYN